MARKQSDLASVAHAKGGTDALFELQRDALSDDKIHKAVAVLSGAAGDALGEFGKLFAFGLAHIEDIGGAESNQNGLILSSDVLLGFLKRVAQDIHPLMLLVYEDEPGKKYYFSGGGTFLTGFAAACGYVRNRNNTKMLEGALEKLILLLKQPSEDPFGLEEYQELIKNITSSRGKMMRRLVYDTFLRFFLGTTTRLEWTDAYRSLSLT